MLGTFVIGLREGLEAALVVGILATFLKRNGASLVPMWCGVVAAVLLSVGVGVTLDLVSRSLPQAAQEGMESIISLVAILFVTSMVVWMNSHSRGMKKELEAAAGDALAQGTTWALVAMAFLAILKEGFETSVFLLATFQASTSTVAAVTGAVLGIVVAVALGVGIYQGGVRFNLGRFFQITSVFLILVAGGLVVSMLHTAHGAGWITVGQGRTVDLAWLTPPGSVRAALITGVLGIPADPRVVEVLGWFLYVVPMLALALWPQKHRLSAAGAVRFKLTVAGGLAVAAVALAVLVPAVGTYDDRSAAPAVASADDPTQVGSATLTGGQRILALTGTDGRPASTVSLAGHPGVATVVDGVAAQEARFTTDAPGASLPATVTLADLTTYGGGRLPVGVNPQTAPGPFEAAWTQQVTTDATTTGDDVLLDASQATKTVLTLSGGGLAASRTVTVDAADLPGAAPDWTVDPAHVSQVVSAVAAHRHDAQDRLLWKLYLPAVLLAAALGFAVAGLRGRRRLAAATVAVQSVAPPQTTRPAKAVPTASAVPDAASASTP
ncbi:iron uptake transporter permease EfeU [Luteimicrobium subarcticum]|uniref:High-affinity iron transporter n=1 Tax=Luteimicrobium subarcticum TaxID=620910 RepID=A0A2M8WUX1_9MICO|nr:iron uptake transporter permease EfeU [Luteimicrobium subarcticum]PJI94709.1 high-affinity iron transporter [Luteimicrobium subarcticum]